MNQQNHDQTQLNINPPHSFDYYFIWPSLLCLFFCMPGKHSSGIWAVESIHDRQAQVKGHHYFDALATCNVTNINDNGPGSFRDGIDCVDSGDTLFFDPSMMNETIILDSPISIGKNIIIYAAPGREIWIDGTGIDSTFLILTGTTVEMINLNIMGRNGPNGVVLNQGNLILNNVTIAGSDSPGTIFSSNSVFEMKNESAILITIPTSGMISDVDGNEYKTVKIGSQWWMAENLRTTRFNEGTPISHVPNDTSWQNLLIPGYCWYGNDSITYADPYGALYNFYSVADTNSLNVCPSGWHIPSSAEWTTLTNFLGGATLAGGKMKEAGTAHWSSPKYRSDE